jgi:hypothetical protein
LSNEYRPVATVLVKKVTSVLYLNRKRRACGMYTQKRRFARLQVTQMQQRNFRFYWIALCQVLLFAAGCGPTNPAAEYSARIGVAVKLNNRICMAVHNSKLLPSATITLLSPGGSASGGATSARAQVFLRNADACPGTKGETDISNYNLEITSGDVQPNLPVIALDARVPSVRAAHSFHSCTSADGVHLTAWDGAKPLEGQRLWHQYYYLGQDLISTCTSAETVP